MAFLNDAPEYVRTPPDQFSQGRSLTASTLIKLPLLQALDQIGFPDPKGAIWQRRDVELVAALFKYTKTLKPLRTSTDILASRR